MPVKSDPKDKGEMVSPQRSQSVDVHRLISLIPISPYHSVADIGCGLGCLTVPLGKYLFDGKVYALDTREEMLEATREALAAVHLTNAEVMRSEEEKLPLEDECLDGALASFVLEEADNPKALLKEARRCLRRSGWLAILEWYKREMDEGPPLEQRIGPEEMKAMTEEMGFRFSTQRDLNGKQYMILVRK